MIRRHGLLLACVLASTAVRAEPVSETSPKFVNESEVGLVITGGNSRTQSYNVQQGNAYSWGFNVAKINGRYLETTSEGIQTVRRWGLSARYERVLTERLSVFFAQALEGDIFAGIKQRWFTDFGAKQYFFKADPASKKGFDWFAEAGYRYMIEHRLGAIDFYANIVRLYTELNQGWNDNVSTRYWIEFLPNLSNAPDYMINTELSISALLTSVFSVKAAYYIRFDNLPAAAYKTDSQITMALVAKY